jgi:hypothetical protein
MKNLQCYSDLELQMMHKVHKPSYSRESDLISSACSLLYVITVTYFLSIMSFDAQYFIFHFCKKSKANPVTGLADL